jgi:hypothetical protein
MRIVSGQAIGTLLAIAAECIVPFDTENDPTARLLDPTAIGATLSGWADGIAFIEMNIENFESEDLAAIR